MHGLPTIHPDDSRCPVCGGCGWTGHINLNGHPHYHSAHESSRHRVVLRQPGGGISIHPAFMDMGAEYGMEVCPFCDEGEHPDATCSDPGCWQREAVIDDNDEPTGLCPDHWIERQQEQSAIDAYERNR